MIRVTVTQGGTLRRRVRLLVTSLAFVAISVAVLALASPALAQTPSFSNVTVYGGDQLDLNVEFTETGLESGATIDYSLDAVADVTFTCYAGVHQTGKRTVSRNQPQSFPFTQQADASGTVSGVFNGYLSSFTQPPPCPGPLVVGSESVTYRQITLTDVTSGVQVAIPGTITSTDHVCSRPRC